MNPTSNTPDCFREFVGKRMIGLLFNAFPRGRRDLSVGSKTLVFEDGRGLTISSNGSYWVEEADAVKSAVLEHAKELDAVKREIAEVIVLSGVL